MTKQAILFDVDGVLINGLHAKEELRIWWDKDIEQDLGINRKSFSNFFATQAFTDVIAGKMDLKVALQIFLPSIDYYEDPETLIAYWYEKDSNINKELLELVSQIKKRDDVQLYIATNQEHGRAEYIMNTLGFNNYFEDIFHSARIGHTKTAPEYYQAVEALLGQLDAPPILFDDTLKVVEAANAYGWSAHEFYDVSSIYKNAFVKECLS